MNNSLYGNGEKKSHGWTEIVKIEPESDFESKYNFKMSVQQQNEVKVFYFSNSTRSVIDDAQHRIYFRKIPTSYNVI